jgi:DNA polymerase-3 subunit delta'
MPFRDIVGHRRLVGLVARSIRRATLPPSLIFAGPEGVGKRLLAIGTAQALNCLNPRITEPDGADPQWAGVEKAAGPQWAGVEKAAGPQWAGVEKAAGPQWAGVEIDACGECSPCAKIARGVHPDVIVVEPGDTGTIKIDQVRDVVDRAGYRPFEGRRRVVIVDHADALVPQAQNALLKTLEEPPPASVFVLVTSRPDALLPTVQSRCPRLRFRPLDADDVASVLMRQGRGEAEARATAAAADGSIGHALAASGEDLVDARRVAVAVLRQAAASDDDRRRLDSTKHLLARTGAGGAADREQLAVNLRAMASLLRDAELLSAFVDAPAGRRSPGEGGSTRAATALANPDVRSDLERLAVFRGERGTRAFTAVDQALVALERNAGVKTVADWIVLQL